MWSRRQRQRVRAAPPPRAPQRQRWGTSGGTNCKQKGNDVCLNTHTGWHHIHKGRMQHGKLQMHRACTDHQFTTHRARCGEEMSVRRQTWHSHGSSPTRAYREGRGCGDQQSWRPDCERMKEEDLKVSAPHTHTPPHLAAWAGVAAGGQPGCRTDVHGRRLTLRIALGEAHADL